MANPDPLRFKVAPHIVEDLGLNLYTSLPRVLVEFVANAYDADSPSVNVTFDEHGIRRARDVMRKQFELEKASSEGTGKAVQPLATRTFPTEIQIVIEDQGFGMSRSDLNNKFLIAGRRRRDAEPDMKGMTPRQRPLMGRKGLGKLAGFGVAKVVEVISRHKDEAHATRVVLDYDQLVENLGSHEIVVPDETLPDGGGIPAQGTRIVLSRLLYDPLKSRAETIENAIAEHFALIDPGDFAMTLNNNPVKPTPRTHAYAWPNPELPVDQFVEHTLPREEGGEIKFWFRIRFTGKNEALPARQRGVRIYAHKRLAAAPSLLAADTNMHGFRMTDYLDGVVHADFIDEEKTDYIATDRQTLRWESPLLAGMHDFLSEQIKEACKNYQAKRDAEAPNAVEEDAFSMSEIAKHGFSKRDCRMAVRIAAVLEGACKRGVEDPTYKTKLPVLIQGLGHGNILAAISQLAEQANPDLNRVAVEVARLTRDELDHFVSSAKARLAAINALKKVVREADFRRSDTERVVQTMLEKSPWLVDPTYSQFLTADKAFNILFERIAKELGVGPHALADAEQDEERPDLVSLIGSESLNRLVIIELKSPNLPLESKHLEQLESYMERAEKWLADHDRSGVKIHGHLVGTLGSPESKARGVASLRRRIRQAGPGCDWKVRDYLEILTDTEAAHRELIAVHERLERADEASGN